MLVHLLRHGIAADTSPTGTDDDRPLTPDGRRKLVESAPAFRGAFGAHLDRIVSSPLLRARETTEVVYEACQLSAHGVPLDAIEVNPDLVHSVGAGVPIRTILEPALLDGCNSILLVGHEPQLGDIFGRLVTGRDTSLPLRKGMLVGIDVEGRTSLYGRLAYALPTGVARRIA